MSIQIDFPHDSDAIAPGNPVIACSKGRASFPKISIGIERVDDRTIRLL